MTKQEFKNKVKYLHETMGVPYTEIGKRIGEKTGQEIRVTIPGHTQRGGSPCPYDRVLSSRFGAAAAQMILDKDYGNMVGIKNGEIVRIPLADVAGKLKMVDPDCSIIKEAKALGISEKTFISRMRRGVFGTDEAEKMIKVLDIKNPIDIFFAAEVTH